MGPRENSPSGLTECSSTDDVQCAFRPQRSVGDKGSPVPGKTHTAYRISYMSLWARIPWPMVQQRQHQQHAPVSQTTHRTRPRRKGYACSRSGPAGAVPGITAHKNLALLRALQAWSPYFFCSCVTSSKISAAPRFTKG